MLVAVNVSIKEYQRNKKLLNLNKEETLEQQVERLKKRNESLKDKERDYKTFVQKLGAKELSDLNADEIKVKLDQIYDWNEKKGKDDKNT
jgi:seryl-tRNA(Sec) selenium transferase